MATQTTKKMMNKIVKIWFEGEWLYGLGEDGKTHRQSLLWYKNLMNASEQQRAEYEISTIGIHWSKLDEDVSFESFDAAEIFIKTDTGDVEGELLSAKVFIAKTDTGKINVPSTATGGRCEISTDTGDIRITVSNG